MANLRVKIRGTPTIAEIEAATIEDDQEHSELRAKDANGNVIARFDRKEIVGWWIEPPTEQQLKSFSLAEEIRKARERVAKIREQGET